MKVNIERLLISCCGDYAVLNSGIKTKNDGEVFGRSS